MKGLDEFISLFGDITVLHIVEIILACVFVYSVGKNIKDYLIKRHDAEQQKDAQLEEALTAVRKYPEWHQHSIKMQEFFNAEIVELKKMHEEHTQRLMQMEETNKRRECNKLRDRLLQNFRYYTSLETNPTQTWTRMESEAFWELFKDYEESGGNGYMHTDVLPAMQRIRVVEQNKEHNLPLLL